MSGKLLLICMKTDLQLLLLFFLFSINNNHVFLKIMFRAKSVSRIYTMTCVRRRNDVQKHCVILYIGVGDI